jgi:uncharacterized protein DUF5670
VTCLEYPFCLRALKGETVLRIAVVALLVVWCLAVFTKHTMGGFAHVLLVFALVFGLISIIRGKNP